MEIVEQLNFGHSVSYKNLGQQSKSRKEKVDLRLKEQLRFNRESTEISQSANGQGVKLPNRHEHLSKRLMKKETHSADDLKDVNTKVLQQARRHKVLEGSTIKIDKASEEYYEKGERSSGTVEKRRKRPQWNNDTVHVPKLFGESFKPLPRKKASPKKKSVRQIKPQKKVSKAKVKDRPRAGLRIQRPSKTNKHKSPVHSKMKYRQQQSPTEIKPLSRKSPEKRYVALHETHQRKANAMGNKELDDSRWKKPVPVFQTDEVANGINESEKWKLVEPPTRNVFDTEVITPWNMKIHAEAAQRQKKEIETIQLQLQKLRQDKKALTAEEIIEKLQKSNKVQIEKMVKRIIRREREQGKNAGEKENQKRNVVDPNRASRDTNKQHPMLKKNNHHFKKQVLERETFQIDKKFQELMELENSIRTKWFGDDALDSGFTGKISQNHAQRVKVKPENNIQTSIPGSAPCYDEGSDFQGRMQQVVENVVENLVSFKHHRRLVEASLHGTGLSQWQIIESLSDLVLEEMLTEVSIETCEVCDDIAGVLFNTL